MENETIPTWALDEAAKRCGLKDWADAKSIFAPLAHKSIRAHAETIARHEQPPADPWLVAMQQAVLTWDRVNSIPDALTAFRASLAEQGVSDV